MDPGELCAVRFECPRCSRAETDEYEVIPPGTACDLRCEGCARVFSVLLMECESCGFEDTLTALSSAEQIRSTDWHCPSCGRSIHPHEDAESDATT